MLGIIFFYYLNLYIKKQLSIELLRELKDKIELTNAG